MAHLLELADSTAVVRDFLHAAMAKDVDAMKRCLTRATLESGQFHGDGPEIAGFELLPPIADGERAVVVAKLQAKEPQPGQPAEMPMPFVLLGEQGGWRIDMALTMERMFGGGLEKIMEEVADKMKDALEGVTRAVSAGLEAAFEPAQPQGKGKRARRRAR